MSLHQVNFLRSLKRFGLLALFVRCVCCVDDSEGRSVAAILEESSEHSEQFYLEQELSGSSEEIQVPKPPFSDKIFPCSRCHSVLPNNFIKRKLEKEHTQIKLQHGVRDRWCFDCHIQDHRDKLRMASGGTVAFTESFLLCGQCHGPKIRDWRLGIHGKRSGNWDGKKQYLLCVHCHDPHSPRFKPMKPLPRPKKPAELLLSLSAEKTKG